MRKYEVIHKSGGMFIGTVGLQQHEKGTSVSGRQSPRGANHQIVLRDSKKESRFTSKNLSLKTPYLLPKNYLWRMKYFQCHVDNLFS